jgi:hypothetical protein
MFRRKKKNPDPEMLSTADASLDELVEIFENVSWARAQIDAMLDAIAEHKSDHICEVHCIPPSIVNYIESVSPDGLRTLLLVMLKDAVIQEEADEGTR